MKSNKKARLDPQTLQLIVIITIMLIAIASAFIVFSRFPGFCPSNLNVWKPWHWACYFR